MTFFNSHYKDQDGLECIKPWRVKMEFSRLQENRPSGKVAWFVFDAPGLTQGAHLDWVIYLDAH